MAGFTLRKEREALGSCHRPSASRLERKLEDRAESPATFSCRKELGAGLAGFSRGLLRPATIVIWSSKIAQLD